MYKSLLIIALVLSCPAVAQDVASGYRHTPFDCNSYSDGSSYRQECLLRNEESAYKPNCSVGEFWSAHMKTDEMTDERSCSISPARYDKDDGGLFVYVDRQGVSFTTMGDEYPDEPMRIRVDKNQPFSFQDSLSGKKASSLLAQILSGNVVLTEYQDWPYNTSNVRSVPVCDLPEKIRACREFIK